MIREVIQRPVNPTLFRRVAYERIPAILSGRTLTYDSGNAFLQHGLPESESCTGAILIYHDPSFRGGADIGFVDDESLAILDAEEAALAAEQRAAAEVRRAESESDAALARNEAFRFNNNLELPFAWTIAQKVRISERREYTTRGRMMPSFNFYGRNTVFHVHLTEPLSIGRFTRNAGELLCSGSDLGNYGVRDLPLSSTPVTCSLCLAVAKHVKAQVHAYIT
jgi:hypothetical protein